MAITRCPPRYKNLGLETFGNKKKVTEEMLKQFCKNDEWLRRNLEEIRYLTPPAIRKTMKVGEMIDMEHSWGCEINSDGRVQFSNRTYDSISIDLTTEEGLNRWYDSTKSTTVTVKNENSDSYIVTLPYNEVTLRSEELFKFGSAEEVKKEGYNSAWYVGYDKSKNYYLRPHLIKDWKKYATSDDFKNNIINAIARAQTFKVPTTIIDSEGQSVELSSTETFPLVKIDIPLEYNGIPNATRNELYVQIWDTYEGWVNVTKWDSKTKTVIPKYWKREEHKTKFGSYPPSTWQRYDKIVKQVKYKKGKKKGQVKETKVSYKKNKNGDYIRKKRKVYKPKPNGGKSIQSPLAEYVYEPEKSTKGGEVTIAFPHPPELKAGHHYAIVLLSPLSNWQNCPRWCGWGRNCNVDKNYEHGNAFYSPDNGRSWKRYGKSGLDEKVKVYQQGKYVPRDYRFRCHVKTRDAEIEKQYETDKNTVYLNPIYNNPIYKLKLNTIDYGSEITTENLSIQYQISTDGDNWLDVNVSEEFELEKELGVASRVVFVRALLKTTNVNDNPYIEKIDVDLWTYPANEMYARTKPYTPDKFGTILGASLWGRVFAPYTLEGTTTDCKVDVIETKEVYEQVDIVELELLEEKLIEKNIPNMGWINSHNNIDSICQYLTDNPSIIKDLRDNYNIYILPHEIDDDENPEMHNLSFAPSNDKLVVQPLDGIYYDIQISNGTLYIENDNIDSEEIIEDDTLSPSTIRIPVYPDEIGGIKLNKEVAYPVINCQLEPEDSEGHGELSSFGEWYDYTFDYESNMLIFKRDTLNRMSGGNLTISYNPVFVKDLTNEEIGNHYDENGDLCEGLILDVFKEKIEILDESSIMKIPLRVDALDPIRQVNLYTSEESEAINLVENQDYYYDIDSHEIVFGANRMANILSVGDILEIIYTPNLDDTSLCVGYHGTRVNIEEQCYIYDYYIEYKV